MMMSMLGGWASFPPCSFEMKLLHVKPKYFLNQNRKLGHASITQYGCMGYQRKVNRRYRSIKIPRELCMFNAWCACSSPFQCVEFEAFHVNEYFVTSCQWLITG